MSSDEDCGDISSDSNLELSDFDKQDYLHEKIGIYVKDHSGSSQDKSQLVELLPAEFGVVIVSYSDEERCDKVTGFSCTLRLSIWDKETILRWLKLFEQKTFTVWRVDSTFKCDKSKKLVFKKNFRCQNNQYNHPNRNKENTRKKRVEHTACPAKISLTIKNHEMRRTSDAYLKEYPAVINIRFTHNHTLRTPMEYFRCIKPKQISPDIKPFNNVYINETDNYLELEDKQNKGCENNDISSNGRNDTKCVLNTDWNDIICDDVFDERTSHSECLEANSENVTHYSEVIPFLDKVCDSLKQKLIEKPELFHLPVLNFVESFNNMKTDNQLIMALNAFSISNSSILDYKKEACLNNIESDNLDSISLANIQSSKLFENCKIEKDDKIFIDTNNDHQYFRLS